MQRGLARILIVEDQVVDPDELAVLDDRELLYFPTTR